jgi:hypothetical protein
MSGIVQVPARLRHTRWVTRRPSSRHERARSRPTGLLELLDTSVAREIENLIGCALAS